MKAILLISGVVIALLLSGPSAQAQDMEQDNPIYKELAAQDRMTTGQIITKFGVPCVEVKLNGGETIMSFVHSIPARPI